MEKLLIILLILVLIIFIIAQIVEIVNSFKFYKRLEDDRDRVMTLILEGEDENGTELEKTDC